MKNDKKLKISIGGSRKDIHWKQTEIMWSAMVERLKTPVRSEETLQEYMALPKAQQDTLKDVGGFVGGSLSGERRKASNVTGRDIVTLDLDNIPTGRTDDILRRVAALGCASCVYSTRKHSDYAPRLRVLLPMARTVTPDEYEPIARQVAKLIGIEFCDPTTFEAVRLMYWPSCSSDSIYICEAVDYPLLNPDAMLNMYGDWRDVAQWPQVPGADTIEKRRVAKQEDPTTKKGAVGAFCSTYTIVEAMERFLPGVYEPTNDTNRYTYSGGSTTGGAVIYEDKWLYSHHATDPCSGLLVNAFDLIRLHKFGDLDAEAKPETPAGKLPSFLAMSNLAMQDEAVGALIAQRRLAEAQAAFGDSAAPSLDADWLKQLKLDGNGNYKKTIDNVVIILKNDPWLKGKIATDVFEGRGMVLGSLPWAQEDRKRAWKDADDSGLYWYLERYGITGRDKIDDALTIVGEQNSRNDVETYLKGLKWDGVSRVDTLLPVYLGADDNLYTRAVMRKSLAAAVSRAVEGGTKYDYMPILTGPQGIGKSTFLANLGKQWFSDSLTTFEGKDAAELIQGTWINEIGELTAMNRQETTAVKQFLSKTDDIYRAAYGRRTEHHPRRCVFFGTSNESEFLKDTTGNRRFWPVDVGKHPAQRSVWADMPGDVDQIWAEAYMLYAMGEKLYLTGEEEETARKVQEEHREASEKSGFILEYLSREIPEDWWSLDISMQRNFMSGYATQHAPLVKRDRTCIAELWAVCFGMDKGLMLKRDSLELGRALKTSGWVAGKSERFGVYGVQKCYRAS